MYLLQSDASGPDGFGYIHGYLHEDDPVFFSQRWTETEYFGTSHHGELQPLVHFLSHSEVRDLMLVWTTDSLSAMFSVDKGRCFEEISLESLRTILDLCDNKRILLVALWAPRELNQLTDYLSHLSNYLDRSSVEGRVSELPLLRNFPTDKRRATQQNQGSKDVELRSLLPLSPTGTVPGNLCESRQILLPACYQQ